MYGLNAVLSMSRKMSADGRMNSDEEKLAILLGNGLWEHLESFSAQALATEPTSSLALAGHGFAVLRRDEVVAAKQLFLDALQADPSDPLPKCGLHLCYIRTGDIAQAEACLLELLEEYPESESLHVSRCWLDAKFGKRKTAEESIAAALQRFPENERLLSAQLYHARRHSSDSDIRSLSMALLQFYPENVLAHLCLGELCLSQHDLDGAEGHFRTCATLDPSESTARMLRWVEAKKTGRGALPILFWTVKRKLLKLLVPGYSRRERLNIKWNR